MIRTTDLKTRTHCHRSAINGIALMIAWIGLVFGAVAGNGASWSPTELERQFHSPPDAARPWVYWFWLDGNISREGITADLEAMKQAGLGGGVLMWGGGVGGGVGIGNVKGPVKLLDPQWWELMRHTVREADRLGLKINLVNGSGWSHSGGPWVKPGHDMRKLVASQEFQVKGPCRTNWVIPDGDPIVCVSAYAAVGLKTESMFAAGGKVTASSTQPEFDISKALDGQSQTRWISNGTGPGEGPSQARPEWLDVEFSLPYSAAGAYVAPFSDCGPQACQVQISEDGREFRTIARFELAPHEAKTVSFDEVKSSRYRLLVTSAHPFQGQPAWNVQIAEFRLLQKGEKPPVLERERFDTRSHSDLTGKVEKTGTLVWDVPKGSWVVRVFRHASTGDRPHPIVEEEGGWECDKLDPEAVEENWKGFVLRVLNECGPAARRVIRWTHADSYEFGVQTWTPRLRWEFQRRCSYDALPFLPALLGATMDDEDVTARFLWDFARVRADLFAENIGGRFRDLCRKEGVSLTTEPHLVPEVFDQIQYGGHVSEPMGNFLGERRTHWYADNPPVGPEVQLAKGEASAANTYGLNGVVWAEAFTGVDHAHAWKESPDYLKTWGDLWLTEGINQFVFHCWAHSPSLTQKPGITLGPWGVHFDRRNTWFDMASGYLKCLTRCQFLLQQGLPVMDVCFFTGDGVTSEFPRHPYLRAAGYDYHGITADILEKAKVEDGWIVLPSGMRYRLLVTYNQVMRPQTIRKLQELVRGGASILGIKPVDAPGLMGYPASGSKVRKAAETLWGSGSDGATGRRSAGKVYAGEPAKPSRSTAGCGIAAWLDCSCEIEVLREMHAPPDFEYSRTGLEDNDHMLAYMHRKIGELDLYFISNQSSSARRENCVFRVEGRSPELWDAVTGEVRSLPVFSAKNGRTTVPLEFAPGQSFFIVFKPGSSKSPTLAKSNFSQPQLLVELKDPWQVQFDSTWGGPKVPVTFDRLDDWSRRSEDGIRHYSGKAMYRTTFTMPEKTGGARLYLDLGRVKELAEVRLNGRALGIVWCAPWRIEITDAVHQGENALELVVANQWINRLIGDSGKPQEERFTWTTHNPYKPGSPLVESGLLGPVTVQAMEP